MVVDERAVVVLLLVVMLVVVQNVAGQMAEVVEVVVVVPDGLEWNTVTDLRVRLAMALLSMAGADDV